VNPNEGWFPDPWRVSAYRWWDGRKWTAYTSPAAQTRAQDARHTLLTLLVGLFSAWTAIWVLAFPLMGLGDADNGRFDHDFRSIWLPNFVLAVIGVGVSVAMMRIEKRRPAMGNRALIPPALVMAVIALGFLVRG
jgi:hypothetical protein